MCLKFQVDEDGVERAAVAVDVLLTRGEIERLQSIGDDWMTVLSVRCMMAGQDLAQEVEQGHVLGVGDVG